MSSSSGSTSLNIPGRLRSRALGVAGGERWLTELPDTVAHLSNAWNRTRQPAFPDCHVSWVAAADSVHGPAVVKIPMPPAVSLGTLLGDSRGGEATALRLWEGRGAVRLLDHDPTSGAMLIERCLPGTSLDGHDSAAADVIAAQLLSRLHEIDGDGALPSLADRAQQLRVTVASRAERLRSPIDGWLVDTAVDVLGVLAEPGPDEVVLHGDFHHHNILRAGRGEWLAIDPLPAQGDPAYDLVQYSLFRQGDLADPARDWLPVIEHLCSLTEADTDRVLAWTFARLVTDAIAALETGTSITELEAEHGDLWTARLVHHLSH